MCQNVYDVRCIRKAEKGDLHHTDSSSDCVANACSHQVDILDDGTESHISATCSKEKDSFGQRT